MRSTVVMQGFSRRYMTVLGATTANMQGAQRRSKEVAISMQVEKMMATNLNGEELVL